MITDVTDRPSSNFLVNAPVECSVSSSLTSLETLYIEHKWTVDSFAVHMDLSPVAEYLTSPVFGSKVLIWLHFRFRVEFWIIYTYRTIVTNSTCVSTRRAKMRSVVHMFHFFSWFANVPGRRFGSRWTFSWRQPTDRNIARWIVMLLL